MCGSTGEGVKIAGEVRKTNGEGQGEDEEDETFERDLTMTRIKRSN